MTTLPSPRIVVMVGVGTSVPKKPVPVSWTMVQAAMAGLINLS